MDGLDSTYLLKINKKIMKTTKEHFQLFKEKCKYYMEKFKINDYKVWYDHKELDDADARTTINLDGGVVFALDTEIDFSGKDGNEETEIEILAKHEAIHVLLGRYTKLAEKRYVLLDELVTEEEHLVRKLMKLL